MPTFASEAAGRINRQTSTYFERMRRSQASSFSSSLPSYFAFLFVDQIGPKSNYHEPGMVAAENLSPQKAALLLSLALTRTSAPDDIQRIFEEY